MFNRLKNLESEFSLSKAAFIVGVLTLLAKLTALIRDPIFSSKFGGPDIYILDIYNAAFRIPDFVSNLLILGTLSAAFIPVYVQLRLRDKKASEQFASTVFNFSFLGIGVLCAVMFALSRPMVHRLVPGFGGFELEQTVRLTRLFLLSPIIFALSSTLTSVLNAEKRFISAGFAPVLYNLGIIFGAIALYPRFGLMGLGYGVILGALMHLGVQIPAAVKFGFSWLPTLRLNMPDFKHMLALYVPRIFSIDLLNISLIISTIIGSRLAEGSIAIFVFATNLQAVPAGLFGISFATAAFPVFSEHFAKNNEKEFIETLYRVIYQIIFFIIPITVMFLVYRAQGVRLYLGHGKFTWQNTIDTFNTLGALSFSILALSITPLLTRAFYGRQNTATPVLVNIASMALNAVLAYELAPKFGVSGLALAFTIASIFNTIVLFAALHSQLRKPAGNRPQISKEDARLVSRIMKILAASVAMGAVGYGSLRLLEPLVNNQKFFGLLLQTSGSAALAVIVYMTAALIMNVSMAKYLMSVLTGKFKKI